MFAILHEELRCFTLSTDKWDSNGTLGPEFFIRHYMDEVYACVAGHRFDRKLLQWAIVERIELGKWCRRRGIPPPLFWFPEGAKNFPHEEVEREADFLFQCRELSSKRRQALDAYLALPADDPGKSAGWNLVEELDRQGGEASRVYAHFTEFGVLPEGTDALKGALKHNQEAKVAVQQTAKTLWEHSPTLLMDEVVDSVRKQCDAERYAHSTVEKWVREISPPHVRARKGPQKGKNLSPG